DAAIGVPARDAVLDDDAAVAAADPVESVRGRETIHDPASLQSVKTRPGAICRRAIVHHAKRPAVQSGKTSAVEEAQIFKPALAAVVSVNCPLRPPAHGPVADDHVGAKNINAVAGVA